MDKLQHAAEADFPTEYGHFRIHGFTAGGDELVAIVMGDIVNDKSAVLVRIHSQCLTGDVFHSLRCDCREQFELAVKAISREGRGVLIYEPKEGRGIGLVNKLRAYQLQDQGHDTVEANEALGFEADLRDYAFPGLILKHFGVEKVRLMSNNPQKIEAMEAAGIEVTERVPIVAEIRESRAEYLQTKKDKMGHLI
jgi:GTP cyclohydrolase II